MQLRRAPPTLLVLLSAWLIALEAAATPPSASSLLAKVRRDVSGALTYLTVLQQDWKPATVPQPTGRVAIAAGGPAVALAALRTTFDRLDRRLDELVLRARQRGDARVEQVAWLMRQERVRLQDALARLTSLPPGADRQQALDELERGLAQLEGAAAALRSLDQ